MTRAYSSALVQALRAGLEGEEGEPQTGRNAEKYSARAGRPRRVGWFDAVATVRRFRSRHGARSETWIWVTLHHPGIVAYNRRTSTVPTTSLIWKADGYQHARWKTDISATRHLSDLPEAGLRGYDRGDGSQGEMGVGRPAEEQTFEAYESHESSV